MEPNNVTFSDGVVGEKKMRRARNISYPLNTNNTPPTARIRHNSSVFDTFEEAKLIGNTNKDPRNNLRLVNMLAQIFIID